MFVQKLSLWGLPLLLVALISGCSMLGFGSESSADAGRGNECKWNRSSCMYEGRYEAGEEAYAEEEARRLNQASAAKVRNW